MKVLRETYIKAEPGVAVYAQSPSYTSVTVQTLLEAVKHEAFVFDPDGRYRYYHPRIFRRVSNDNGKSWVSQPGLHTEDPSHLDGQHRHVPMHILDPNTDRLISIHSTYEVDTQEYIFAGGNLIQRTYRLWYEVSCDGGKTWSSLRQIVDSREGYDAEHWGPGLTFGQNGAMADLSKAVFLPDGSFVLGLTVSNATGDSSSTGEGAWSTGHLRGSWDADGHTLKFQFGEHIQVPKTVADSGCCEPAVTRLTGDRLFTTMRCQGAEDRDLFSSRQCSISEDGGLTWTVPKPLCYDDGQEVFMPASFSSFIESTTTGKTWMFGNILTEPVRGQTPRYPLVMAELNTDRACVMRNSVTAIQQLPEGAPVERRYSNWGSYEERGSGDFILTMPEQPKSHNFSEMEHPDQFTADCIRFRIAAGT